MKLRVLFALLFLTFTAAVTTIPCDADAARMGGGRSFGSQPAMRAPAARPQNPGYAPGAIRDSHRKHLRCKPANR